MARHGNPPVMMALVKFLRHEVPGIGPKTAERIARWVVEGEKEKVGRLAGLIMGTRDKVGLCKMCHGYSDREVCRICEDPVRSDETILVLVQPQDVSMVERLGTFNGKYHVLGGTISPLDDIGPDDLNIADLIARVNENGTGEVIIATGNDTQGALTATYLAKTLGMLEIEVTVLPTGIPAGTALEQIDDLTLQKAIDERIGLQGQPKERD